ncbi:MDR family MFS transporter [Lentzea nigeriaca]|uniref:MDR family MFS transporter n=1 Tax=Lentzea nigeriaca TaxID=1128665 RepID=UPI0019561D82|nr:MDR family MFS transporter [Lentzea nigeriaca]MBM7856371.1 EmrB/QacA subfamily drug resistance transporter [Lentzea nigeriaca]
MSTTARQGLSNWQLRTVLVVLLSGQLLSALDQTIVGTALPTMVSRLGLVDDFSLVVTAYLLTSTVSTALYGKLADLYGAKPMYLVSIGIFTAGSALVGASQDMTQLVAFRALQGIGAGGLVVLAFTISSSVVPPRQIGRIQGLVGAMYALASLAGPLVGGVFTEYLSWRWCFLINVPIGVAALLAVGTLLKLPVRRREQSIDYTGAALLTAGVTTLVLATVWGGGTYAWSSPMIIGLLGTTVVLGVLFVVVERRAPEPLVPLNLLRDREIAVAMVVTFLVGAAVIGGYFFLPVYLQVVRGDDPVAAGLQLLPLMIAVMIGSGVSGWLIASVLGRMKPVVVLGTAIMTVATWLLSLLDVDTPVWQLWGSEAVLGIGMGMVISKLIVAVQNSVPREDMGTITAQAAFFRTIGSSIGAAVFGAVIAAAVGRGQVLTTSPSELAAAGFADGLQLAFLAGVPIMIVALVLTLLLPNTPLREDVSPWGEESHSEPESSSAQGK